MVHFSLNIKACCLYVIWEKQDRIWAKIFCIPKNMHSRTLMLITVHTFAVVVIISLHLRKLAILLHLA